MTTGDIPNHLLEQARRGYRNEWTASHLPQWGSDTYCAYLAGQYMKATGRAEPFEVRKAQGHYWIINDTRYMWIKLTEEHAVRQPENAFIRVR